MLNLRPVTEGKDARFRRLFGDSSCLAVLCVSELSGTGVAVATHNSDNKDSWNILIFK